MEKNLMATEGKDEALKQSFAEIKKAATEKKAEPKTAAKKTDTKTSAKAPQVKAAAEKKEETKTAAKKPAAKKTETKTASKAPAKKVAEKKPAAKKPVEKKPVEKKATAKASVSTFVTLQINNQDYDPAKLQEEAIAAAQKIKADVEKVDVYINVAESAAYYTIDGKGSADYRIDL
ncbi:hypothetical protein UYO_0172 [Lachnospiraceae bacterium JC7]|nr:hypothetical protein UYO_0172 [Lachnospiraceae bacterium JC7]